MPQWTLPPIDMGIHGWIALALAVIGIASLHFGLMWLVRKSHDSDFKGDDGGANDPGDHEPKGR